ncbi:unnamed protein product, partial [Larinioides sclopetarius]
MVAFCYVTNAFIKIGIEDKKKCHAFSFVKEEKHFIKYDDRNVTSQVSFEEVKDAIEENMLTSVDVHQCICSPSKTTSIISHRFECAPNILLIWCQRDSITLPMNGNILLSEILFLKTNAEEHKLQKVPYDLFGVTIGIEDKKKCHAFSFVKEDHFIKYDDRNVTSQVTFEEAT